MKNDNYTIKKLCEKLNQPRQKIRRRIIKLEIKAINEDTRTYKNEPLKYDYKAFLKLAEEFDVQDKESNMESEQQSTAEELSKDKLINVLEQQLEEANKSRENLEKLLDQQQQLTMMSNRKIEALQLELEEKEVQEIDNKDKRKARWYDIFKW